MMNRIRSAMGVFTMLVLLAAMVGSVHVATANMYEKAPGTGDWGLVECEDQAPHNEQGRGVERATEPDEGRIRKLAMAARREETYANLARIVADDAVTERSRVEALWYIVRMREVWKGEEGRQ